MLYSEEELQKLSKPQLQDILKNIGQKTSGNRDVLMDRILELDEPDPEKSPNRHRDSPSPGRDQEPRTQNQQTVEKFGQNRGLSGETMQALDRANYRFLSDLDLLDLEDIKELALPQRDAKVLMQYLGLSKQPPSVLLVGSKKNARVIDLASDSDEEPPV